MTDPLEELRSRLGLPTHLPADPMPMLAGWLEYALRAKAEPNPNAMMLATASSGGAPSARMVLCKCIEVPTASLVFFTNYHSRKATELDANPRAACVFHWDHAGRQARVEGTVERVDAAESDEYFRSRHLLSRLGAWASSQGQPLARRSELIDRVREVMGRFGVGLHHFALPSTAPEIPRPPHWGGYRLHIDALELWLGGGGRLHDRAIWRHVPGTSPALWHSTRIQP